MISLALALAIVSTAVAKPRGTENFDFLYATGRGTRIDTYHSTITKDMVEGPDTTVACVLSEADLDSVRDKVIEIHFFEMKEPYPDLPSGASVYRSQHWYETQATLGPKTEKISVGDDVPIGPQTGDWKGIQGLILKILKRQPAYKALPRARGIYFD